MVARMASICATASLMPLSVPAPGTSLSAVGANLQVIVWGSKITCEARSPWLSA